MLMNNLKSLIIHVLISASSFLYTVSPYLEQYQADRDRYSELYVQPRSICVIIFISSLFLYYLTGRMFLQDQLSPSRNILSVSLVPVAGMVIWTALFIKYKASESFQLIDWKPYLIYIGYTTPLVYRYLNSWNILPFLSWVPAGILFLSIRSSWQS